MAQRIQALVINQGLSLLSAMLWRRGSPLGPGRRGGLGCWPPRPGFAPPRAASAPGAWVCGCRGCPAPVAQWPRPPPVGRGLSRRPRLVPVGGGAGGGSYRFAVGETLSLGTQGTPSPLWGEGVPMSPGSKKMYKLPLFEGK